MKLIFAAFSMALIAVSVSAQARYQPYVEKPGSCPPALPVQICTQTCFTDSQCNGIAKCCETTCGGTTCIKPVTMKLPLRVEKPGFCPSKPTGRWVCTPTCSVDSDCRGSLKCCKNRCGALACQKPEITSEILLESEIPPAPISDNSEPVRRSLMELLGYPNTGFYYETYENN